MSSSEVTLRSPINPFLASFTEPVERDIELTKDLLGPGVKDQLFDYFIKDKKFDDNPNPVFLYFALCFFVGGVNQISENDEKIQEVNTPVIIITTCALLFTVVSGFFHILEVNKIRNERELKQKFRAKLESEIAAKSKITGQPLGMLFRLSIEKDVLFDDSPLDNVRHCYQYLSPKQVCKGLKNAARELVSDKSQISQCRLKLLKEHVHKFNPWVRLLFEQIILLEENRLCRYERTAVLTYLKNET